jgi:hypothetical protein
MFYSFRERFMRDKTDDTSFGNSYTYYFSNTHTVVHTYARGDGRKQNPYKTHQQSTPTPS